MGRQFSHLLGTVGMPLVMLLWLPLLNGPKVDHLVVSFAGPQHEYKIVLNAAPFASVLAVVAAIRGSKGGMLGWPCRLEPSRFSRTVSCTARLPGLLTATARAGPNLAQQGIVLCYEFRTSFRL